MAEILKYQGRKYGIPLDRAHIVGHDNVTAAPNVLQTPASVLKNQHTDPGPFWNWMLLMALVGSPSLPSDDLNTNFVTVAPTWPLSKLPVTGCNPGNQPSCVEPGLRPTNFVYLRTEAREDAPMISDPALGQGSTEVANNAARVFYGQTFALAERPKTSARGVWYKIFVQGTTGWFFSPWTAPTGLPVSDSKVKSITIAPEKANVPTYARPLPEPGEFPAELMQCPTPPKPSSSCWIPTQTPLPYVLPAGHKYVVVDDSPTTQHFYAWDSKGSFPYSHTMFSGATKYVEIQAGNRTLNVKRGDVIMN